MALDRFTAFICNDVLKNWRTIAALTGPHAKACSTFDIANRQTIIVNYVQYFAYCHLFAPTENRFAIGQIQINTRIRKDPPE